MYLSLELHNMVYGEIKYNQESVFLWKCPAFFEIFEHFSLKSMKWLCKTVIALEIISDAHVSTRYFQSSSPSSSGVLMFYGTVNLYCEEYAVITCLLKVKQPERHEWHKHLCNGQKLPYASGPRP